MAKKRMFSLGVLETDAFLDMPLSAQALYFHLNLRADDDGFVGNPKRITQNIGANIDDLKLLIAKRFLIAFDDGVIVIKHWRMHNAIKKDRYTETNFTEDLKMLSIKDNGAYTLKDVAHLEHEWSTDGAQMSQTGSTDKIRIGKVSIENNICAEPGQNSGSKSYSDEFETVWKAYPRKVKKGYAYKAYMARLSSGWSPEQLLGAVKAYALECKKNHTQVQYIMHASTFFSADTPFTDYMPKEVVEEEQVSDDELYTF